MGHENVRAITTEVIHKTVLSLIELVPSKSSWREALSSELSADKAQNWMPVNLDHGFSMSVLKCVAEGFVKYLAEIDVADQMHHSFLPCGLGRGGGGDNVWGSLRLSSGSGALLNFQSMQTNEDEMNNDEKSVVSSLSLWPATSSLSASSLIAAATSSSSSSSSSLVVLDLANPPSSSIQNIRELHRSSKKAPIPKDPSIPSDRARQNDYKEMDIFSPEDQERLAASLKSRAKTSATVADAQHLSSRSLSVIYPPQAKGKDKSKSSGFGSVVGTNIPGVTNSSTFSGAPKIYRSNSSGRANDAVEEWDEQDALEAAALEGQHGDDSDDDEDEDEEEEEEGEGKAVEEEDEANKIASLPTNMQRIKTGRPPLPSHRLNRSSSKRQFRLKSLGKQPSRQGRSSSSGPTRLENSNAPLLSWKDPDFVLTQDCPTPPIIPLVTNKGPPSSADFQTSLRRAFEPINDETTEEQLAGRCEQPPSPHVFASINSVPMAVIGLILSYLPLPEIIRAGRVCKEWREEVRTANSISVVDFGSIFAGSIAPDAKLFDQVSRSVRGRDYSFANCTWLTTGALLHAIGVPLSVTPMAPLPPLARQAGALADPARQQLAKELADSLSSLSPGPSSSIPSLPLPQCRPGASHSFSRIFLGESLDAEMCVKENTDAGKHPFPLSRAQLVRAAWNLPSLDADVEDGPSDAATDINNGRGGGGEGDRKGGTQQSNRWWQLLGAASASWMMHTSNKNKVAGRLPISSPPSSSSSLIQNPTSWLNLHDLSLGFINSEVVRSRSRRMQMELLVVESAVEDEVEKRKRIDHSNIFSSVSARAYIEMWLSLRAIIYLHKEAVSRTRLPLTSSLYQPLSPKYNLLVNGKSPINSHCVIASCEVFEPLGDLRRRIAIATKLAHDAQVSSLAAAAEGGGGGGGVVGSGSAVELIEHKASIAKLTKELGSLAILASAETASSFLSELATIHSISVAYATAAGDMFAFPLLLNDEKNFPSSSSSSSGDEVLLHNDSALNRLEGNFCSFDLPAPITQLRNLASNTSLKDQSALIGPNESSNSLSMMTSSRNVFGDLLDSIPPYFVSHVTGLDLHGCVRLAPQNFPIILRFCPHISVLRLSGCNQLSSSVLVAGLSLLPKLKQLDLDYTSCVNDDVLEALGRHCPLLTRLGLVGCTSITDVGLSSTGLFNQCSRLRRLNLRGCDKLTDVAIKTISQRCPQLRELGLSGLTKVSALSIATLVLSCRKLKYLKAELWFDLQDGTHPPARPEEDDDVVADIDSKRTYRVLNTVRGAIKYIQSILPEGDPLIPLLQMRHREMHVPRGWAANGAGMPLPVECYASSGVETSEMMTPAFNRRGNDEAGGRGGREGREGTDSVVGSVNRSFFAAVPDLVEASLGPGTLGDELLRVNLSKTVEQQQQ
jgi:hypothetical protein